MFLKTRLCRTGKPQLHESIRARPHLASHFDTIHAQTPRGISFVVYLSHSTKRNHFRRKLMLHGTKSEKDLAPLAGARAGARGRHSRKSISTAYTWQNNNTIASFSRALQRQGRGGGCSRFFGWAYLFPAILITSSVIKLWMVSMLGHAPPRVGTHSALRNYVHARHMMLVDWVTQLVTGEVSIDPHPGGFDRV